MPHVTGDCQYDLVSATKGKPLFSKVAPDGKLWYCGDEGEEFFLFVKNIGCQERSVVQFKVDNRSMLYNQSLKPTTSRNSASCSLRATSQVSSSPLPKAQTQTTTPLSPVLR